MLEHVEKVGQPVVLLCLILGRIASDPALYAHVCKTSSDPDDPVLKERLEIYQTWLHINYRGLVCSTFGEDNSKAIMLTFVQELSVSWLCKSTEQIRRDCREHAAI
jgi:hypothetical protein